MTRRNKQIYRIVLLLGVALALCGPAAAFGNHSGRGNYSGSFGQPPHGGNPPHAGNPAGPPAPPHSAPVPPVAHSGYWSHGQRPSYRVTWPHDHPGAGQPTTTGIAGGGGSHPTTQPPTQPVVTVPTTPVTPVATTPVTPATTVTPTTNGGGTTSITVQSHSHPRAGRHHSGASSSAGSVTEPRLTALPTTVAPRTSAIPVVARAAARTPAPRHHVIPAPSPARPSVINRIVNVVPGGVWILLLAALAFAAGTGASALRGSRRARRQAREIATVSAAALTDGLTGLLNRRGFTEAVERELSRARRYERPFVLAYMDVRGLKAVNDSRGHLAGDALLREVAAVLSQSARAADVVARIGGDELALLLVEQRSDTVASVIERIQAEVQARQEQSEGSIRWELTIGTAAFPEDGDDLEQLLAVADRRLYEQRGIALR